MEQLLEFDENKVELVDDISFSKDDSFLEYKKFIKLAGYSQTSQHQLLLAAERVHRLYDNIDSLNDDIRNNSLLGLAKKIGKQASQKYTAYFYFLAMIRLVDIQFEDYFQVNPKTIKKLNSWYSLYDEEIGLTQFLSKAKEIVDKTTHRDLNWERDKRLIRKTVIYLMLRYKLFSIYSITVEQWLAYRKDLYEKVHEHAQNYTPVKVMQQAFWELEIFDIRIKNRVFNSMDDCYTRTYLFDLMPNVKPVTDLYKEYCISNYKKTTNAHKFQDLEAFFSYLNDLIGADFKLSSLTRGIVFDYLSKIKSMDFSPSFKQGHIYAVKQFLEFINSNSNELLSMGVCIPKKLIMAKSDFKVDTYTFLPRPIVDKVLNALLETLKGISNERFKVFIMLLLTTGIPQREVLHLTYNCVKKVGDNIFEIFYYREKSKRFKIVKVDSVVNELVTKVQQMNTQTKPLPHPNGKEEYYLFNDGGTILDSIWYKRYFDILKQEAVTNNPELAEQIKATTLHQFRHTFATNMRERGADILTLSKLMGHEQINTTRAYVKESDTKKLYIIEKLEKSFSCDAISDIKSVLMGAGGSALLNNLKNFKNYMGIGTCIINGYDNCAMAHKCLDCMYLCSTKEDIPEMVRMIQALHREYTDSKNVDNKKIIKMRIQRLCDKIAAVRIPNVPDDDSTDTSTSVLSFI